MASFKITALAESAYQAYGKTVNFKNYQGNPMPVWEDLPPAVQSAWEAAVEVVVIDGIVQGTVVSVANEIRTAIRTAIRPPVLRGMAPSLCEE